MHPHPEGKAEFWFLHLNTGMAEVQEGPEKEMEMIKEMWLLLNEFKRLWLKFRQEKTESRDKAELAENMKVVDKEDLECQYCN